MKKMKQLIATINLIGIIIIGVSAANAGVIVDLHDENQQPCSISEKKSDTNSKLDFGVIVDFTGVIVDLIGVIVDFKADSNTNCGVIVD